MYTKLTRRGQITIPIELRRALRLDPGNRLFIMLTMEGHIKLVPIEGSLEDLKGMVKPERKLSLEEMEAVIGVAEHGHARRGHGETP